MTITAQTCGYGCGKPWRPFIGTKLKGHARCALTPELRRRVIAAHVERPIRRQADIAAELGVSVPVLRAWIAYCRDEIVVEQKAMAL